MRTLLLGSLAGPLGWWCCAVVLTLLLALVALLPGRAVADVLVTSDPPAGEIIGATPHVIVLTFDEPLAFERGAHDVIVEDAQGHRVDAGDAQIATYSDRTLIVSLEEAEGALQVSWQATFVGASDLTTGELTFTVEPGVVPLVAEETIPVEPRSSESIVLWTVGIMAGIGVFVSLLYFFRVATGNGRSSVDSAEEAHH